MAEVRVNEGESIESALRRFKRRVQQEDIIKEVKKHSYYMKPGDKRRAKQALAQKKTAKEDTPRAGWRLASKCQSSFRGHHFCPAWMEVMAATLTISSTLHPRDRSFAGLARP